MHAVRTRSQLRRPRHQGLVAVVSALIVFTAAVPAQRASAAVPAPPWSPVLNAGAEPAWGYLETQATDLLAAHGLSTATSEQYARSLIRSYIFGQLITIIGEANSGATLSAQDRGALTYLEQQVFQERHWSDLNAYAKYVTFATQEQSCKPGTGPMYSDGSLGMGGIACVFAQAFGNQPSAAAFNAVGFSEAMQAFEEPNAAQVFFDTAHSLSWWSTLQVTTGESAEQASLQEQLQEVLKDKLTEVGKEALQETGTALVEVAGGEAGAASWAVAAAAVAIIAASGIWNRATNLKTADALESNAANTPAVDDTAIAALADPQGAAELFYVVLAQTLPTGSAIPSNATGVDATPCSWDSSASYTVNSTNYSGCFGYTFAADPDYTSARYAANSATPPVRDVGDPEFILTQQGSSAATVSPTLQNANATLAPWVASDRGGNGLLYDSSSARGVSGIAGNYLVAGQSSPEQNAYAYGEGYSSYIHDNMFVTQFADSTHTAGYGKSWAYQQGIRYVDWSGNWWIAWYQDGTFLHVKIAAPIGPVRPADATDDFGFSPCVENPIVPGFPYSSLYQFESRGGCLFFGNSSYVSSVSSGDALLVDGQVRLADKQVECYYVNDFSLFGVHSYCSNDNTKNGPVDDTGYGFAANAWSLQAGVSTNWTAFSGWDVLGAIFELPKETFTLGATDNHAMRLIQVNSCLGRTGCTGQADLQNCYQPLKNPANPASADCFVSPTIDYQATVAGTSTQNWSATLAAPPVVTGSWAASKPLSLVEGNASGNTAMATFTSNDPTAPASRFSATIDWGDGSSGPGTVTQTGTGQFSVSGDHTYADEGSYSASVDVTDTLSDLSGTASDPVDVQDAALSASAATFTGTEGQAISAATVATFSDANPGATTADFTSGGGSVTIDWGDGTSSAGTVTQTGTGQFSVSGSHTYVDEGSYSVAVSITDDGGNRASATGQDAISDAALSASAATFSGTEGQAISAATVATFSDANPGATTADFTSGGGSVTIDWGDGTSSAGTVTQTGTGQFSVSGSHTYVDEGSYSVAVSIADDGGSTASATQTVQIADAALAASGTTVVGLRGQTLTPTVATFSDANPGATTADFTSGGGSVTIDWGDGSSGPGTVTQTGTGQFSVSGSHAFSGLGPHKVTVTIVDDGGSTATAITNAIVFTYPAGGTFVIGDGNSAVGSSVTFWDARWAKKNSLDGGSAPAAFKGFENAAAQPSVGGAWTTNPGNSAPPPAGALPTYMGVIVSSQITRSGRSISGDIVSIVVVKVDPGYRPAPGHPGTGTIVAIYK